MPLHDFSPPATLTSRRLRLEPLRTEHAEEMVAVLTDPELHTFIGGEPPTLEDLQGQYSRQSIGHSADGNQLWFNWILRREDGQVIGTVQATVTETGTGLSADVAWVVGTAFQHQGFAREAAGTMVTWLLKQGVGEVVAHVHPDHHASASVARAIGLTPTETIVDGEVRWRG